MNKSILKNKNKSDFIKDHILFDSIPSLDQVDQVKDQKADQEASKNIEAKDQVKEAEANQEVTFDLEAVKSIIKEGFNLKVKTSQNKEDQKVTFVKNIVKEAINFSKEVTDQEGNKNTCFVLDLQKASIIDAKQEDCFNQILYKSFFFEYQKASKQVFDEVKTDQKAVFEKSYFYRVFKTCESCLALILCYMVKKGSFEVIKGNEAKEVTDQIKDQMIFNIQNRYFEIFKNNHISFEGLKKSFEILEALTNCDALSSNEALQSIKDKYEAEAKAKKQEADQKSILKDFGYSGDEAEAMKGSDSVTLILRLLDALTDDQRDQVFEDLKLQKEKREAEAKAKTKEAS